ncbi:hypothetical protein D9611_009230 [Ephemerocybe angulata]|uniref:Inhibitor I9 domain-containing protein n=1 Tax=Ephemerocybe angulata TaxID=980116 RepID=A0A8H5BHR4_9AGAR|nr:hypothetical protein D9611_009230 [Tulosesus angulatus]
MTSLLQLRRIRQAHSTLRSNHGQGPLSPYNHPNPLVLSSHTNSFSTQSPPTRPPQEPATMSEIGKFIVVFKKNVTSDQIEKYAQDVTNAGGEVKDRYDQGAGILNGFSATIPASFHASLQGDSLVDYIEPDGVVTIQK